jgi:uncharacterized membrane protein YheB (UPF0754 family)
MENEIVNVLKQLNDINARLTSKRYPFITPLRIMMGCGTLTICTYFMFKQNIVDEGSKLASDIVNSQKVQLSVKMLLNDAETKKIITDATNEWLSHIDTKTMITDVTKQWLTEKTTQDMLTVSTKEWLNNKHTQDMLASTVIKICERDDVKNSISDLIKSAVSDAIPMSKYILLSNDKKKD